ncbi:hypothetical protein EK904_002883, partial [Melospiza melodia maxima]
FQRSAEVNLLEKHGWKFKQLNTTLKVAQCFCVVLIRGFTLKAENMKGQGPPSPFKEEITPIDSPKTFAWIIRAVVQKHILGLSFSQWWSGYAEVPDFFSLCDTTKTCPSLFIHQQTISILCLLRTPLDPQVPPRPICFLQPEQDAEDLVQSNSELFYLTQFNVGMPIASRNLFSPFIQITLHICDGCVKRPNLGHVQHTLSQQLEAVSAQELGEDGDSREHGWDCPQNLDQFADKQRAPKATWRKPRNQESK